MLDRRFVLLLGAAAILRSPSIAMAQSVDRPMTERIFRYGAGSGVANVSPTTGHPEVVIPVLSLPGTGVANFEHSLRYSQGRRFQVELVDFSSQPLANPIPAERAVRVSGEGNDAGAVGPFSTRPWRTMPLYRLRAMTQRENDSTRNVTFLVRYLLLTPEGRQVEFREFSPGQSERYRCNEDIQTAARQNRWRAIDGSGLELDHSVADAVVVYLPGGTSVHFPWRVSQESNSCNALAPAIRARSRIWEAAATRVVDANGNWVSFVDSDIGDDLVGTVRVATSNGLYADFEYVQTKRATGSERLVRSIDFPGLGGVRLKHRFVWETRFLDEERNVNPLVPLSTGLADRRASRLIDLGTEFMVLRAIHLADGSSYEFDWHDSTYDGDRVAAMWSGLPISDGRLMRVRLPSGGRVEFEYRADACAESLSREAIAYASVCGTPPHYEEDIRRAQLPLHCDQDPEQPNNTRCLDPWSSMIEYKTQLEQRLDWRRVARMSVFAGPGEGVAASTTYSASVTFGGDDCRVNESRRCGFFQLSEETGSYTKVSRYFTSGSHKFGQLAETLEYEGQTLVRQTTHGFLLGEGNWAAEKTMHGPYGEYVNLRSLRTSVREGDLRIDTTYRYDRSGGRACVGQREGEGPCYEHTRMLVEETSTLQGDQLLRTQSNEYVDEPEYVARGLWGLPTRTRILDAEGRTLSREDRFYDEVPVEIAPGAVVDAVLGPRGNLTRTRTWLSESQFADRTATFYSNGLLATERSATGAETRHVADFRPCGDEPVLRVLSTINALGQGVETRLDCHTQLQLSGTDENGNESGSAFDAVGRTLRTWLPGDSDQTPTTWYEYFPFAQTGAVGSQRVVEHTRDGSADGIVKKTFLDGLGRVVQVRAEVDPTTTAGGFGETVTTTVYDQHGRVARAYEPCGDVVSDRTLPVCTTNFVATSYDVLGRAVVVDMPGPALIRTTYSPTRAGTLSISDDGIGGIARVLTDALGQRLRVDARNDSPRASNDCPDGFCSTLFTTDALGRNTRIVDPRGNTSTYAYDWGGRVLSSSDPDRGSLTFSYDLDGRETARTDARAITTRHQYDVLGRVVLEDGQPAGPGEEDIRYFYDGEHAADCYSCDDHNDATIDVCDPATLLCTHS